MSSSDIELNSVFVVTDDDARNAIDWANLATNQILSISDTVDEPLRSQAVAFKKQMSDIIANYITIAIEADRIIQGVKS